MKKKIMWSARVLMVLYVCAVAYLCFAHFNDLSGFARTIMGIETDKIVHFCMFLPFPVLAFFSLSRKPSKVWQSLLCVFGIFLAGCVMAGITEVVQSHLPYRTMDVGDFKADMLALIISSLLVYVIDTVKIIKNNA